MVWSCPKIISLWKGTERETSQVLGREVKLIPRVALLWLLENIGGIRKERTFIKMVTSVAKRDIARKWKQPEPPSMAEWHRGVKWCANHEKPIYDARGCPQKHDKIWSKWWRYHGLNGTV